MAGFTAIATGVSIGMSVYGGIKEGQRAKAARRDAKNAQQAAKDAIDAARAKQDINFYESLSVIKEPFERERDALLAQGATALEAAQEAGIRGTVGASGRVLAAQQSAQADISKRMGAQMQKIDMLVAEEDSRLRDNLAQLDLSEASGAQQFAQAKLEESAEAKKSQMDAFGRAGKQLMEAAPLYGNLFKKAGVAGDDFSTQIGESLATFDTAANDLRLDDDFFDQNLADEEIVYNLDGSVLYDPNQ